MVGKKNAVRRQSQIAQIFIGNQLFDEQFEVAPESCFKPGERTLRFGLALFRHARSVAPGNMVGYALAGQGTE